MRFLAGGPLIPDELLIARDEGRVVFFCGAGVSRARAGLVDFWGLAERVSETLGVAPDSPVKKLVEEAREIASRIGVSGLIAADRVFGLLERDFAVADIHAAVAKALKPNSDADLSAHRTMLGLARGPDGRARLVTTNFDLLFELCHEGLQSWQPPRLPEPRRYDDLDGIVHLHGRVNKDYTGADGEGLVLSSSEFGRAYLSEAWATEFIRSILDKYLVVFVGYTADDPPVQYLLEALNRRLGPRPAIYAFQAGDDGDAQSKWIHKGVQPIAYEEMDSHAALWNTLAEWSIRAKDVDAWYDKTIAFARQGPEPLMPHQRGQVAHIVSTVEGVKKFAASDDPPPATWLCVFDRTVRYSTPRHEYKRGESEDFVDPFALFGLDSDPIPPKIDPKDVYAKRELPEDAWDCFALNRLDRQDLRDENLPALRGHYATRVANLPARMWQLGMWIRKVCNQPACAWWAAGQIGVHQDIQERISFELERLKKVASQDVRKAWRYIFEARETHRSNPHHEWYNLKALIEVDGWSSGAVRESAAINRPFFAVQRPWGTPRPPGNNHDVKLGEMVHVDVKYPEVHETIAFPDEWLSTAVREFRKNLELAVVLENELGGYGLHDFVPIERDPEIQGESTARSLGISLHLLTYVGLFRKLVEIDISGAKQELLAWRKDDETIFARLRIWACGIDSLLTGAEVGQIINELPERVFWGGNHQRDLLLVLARRWTDLPSELREQIEKRLLQGRQRWEKEEEEHHLEHRAWLSLSRIHWLLDHGCLFQFDIEAEVAKLQQFAPKWRREFSSKAAASMEPRGGWVRRDQEHGPLVSVPLSQVLDKAQQLSGRQGSEFVEHDPFAGLAAKRPIRAFSALTHAGKRGSYPEWAWRTFLHADARKSDRLKFSALIAERISRIPKDALGPLTYSVSEWLLKTSDILLQGCREQFTKVWEALISALRSTAERGQSSVIRGNKKPDWATEALNAPVGKLAEAVLKDPEIRELKLGEGFSSSWLRRVDELLGLEGDLRRHALAMLSYRLGWFYAIDPQWTEKQILSFLDGEEEDQGAVWAGFFWGVGSVGITPQLFLRLKSRFLELAKSGSLSRRGHIEGVAALILLGWGNITFDSGVRAVSDAEARDVLANSDENFRLHILWQLERWSEGEKPWLDQVVKFLRDVWPRQKRAKSPKISARLCELALSNPAIFSQVVDVVLPLVIKADGEHLLLNDLLEKDGVVGKHPGSTLALLHSVLPDDTSTWPYRIEEVLQRIGDADPTLLKDSRLIELKRQWNAR